MTNIERRDLQISYISDEEVFEEQKRARKPTRQLNMADRSDFETIAGIVKELLDLTKKRGRMCRGELRGIENLGNSPFGLNCRRGIFYRKDTNSCGVYYMDWYLFCIR